VAGAAARLLMWGLSRVPAPLAAPVGIVGAIVLLVAIVDEF
jgi:hypothetical protein